MATIVDLPYALPAASGSASAPSTSKVALSPIKIEPAGPAFLGYERRALRNSSFEEDDKLVRARIDAYLDANKEVDELDNDIGEEPESEELLRSDPKEWKTQDHYAVLGLASRRYKATDYEIKIAHRKKVLKHHPDKKAGATGLANEDSFFKCIAKAHEILSNPEKRRQFDSVDEGVDDDDVPTGKESPERFYALWGPVFEREGRFSKVQPVPALGDAESTKEHVDEFYDFFYNFDSWRSFEYLDKDVNEGSDSRDEKRYTEKKNRNERARRKKEDNARLRTLVDRALSVDPRIKAFRAAERAAREAKKNKGRPGAAARDPAAIEAEKKAKAEAEAKAAEEARAKEEAEKAARADAKKQREAAKKNLKKEKKALRQAITNYNYFAEGSPSASVMDKQLNALDAISTKLEPEQVAALREEVEKADAAGAKAAFQRAAEASGFADAFV
ncbi:hydroxymethylglutaryl-CoA lyase [Malassezia cuniculi]|uniref:Hydroxymethylglutaryl-CoA lyase n=1 Tax=Malassezia cuniculi TaxID=948313 RepID=A0AAF0J4Z1_9BASI|nr:hydroxymethylglutaryl-CoA lyase [Malassezia cuniculi]